MNCSRPREGVGSSEEKGSTTVRAGARGGWTSARRRKRQTPCSTPWIDWPSLGGVLRTIFQGNFFCRLPQNPEHLVAWWMYGRRGIGNLVLSPPLDDLFSAAGNDTSAIQLILSSLICASRASTMKERRGCGRGRREPMPSLCSSAGIPHTGEYFLMMAMVQWIPKTTSALGCYQNNGSDDALAWYKFVSVPMQPKRVSWTKNSKIRDRTGNKWSSNCDQMYCKVH